MPIRTNEVNDDANLGQEHGLLVTCALLADEDIAPNLGGNNNDKHEAQPEEDLNEGTGF